MFLTLASILAPSGPLVNDTSFNSSGSRGGTSSSGIPLISFGLIASIELLMHCSTFGSELLHTLMYSALEKKAKARLT